MSSLFNKIKSIFHHSDQSETMGDKDNNYINLIDKVRNLVAIDNLGEALDLLIEAGNEEAKLLKSRLLDLQQKVNYGKIRHQDGNVIHAEIACSILEIVCPSEVKPQNENLIEVKDELGEHTLVKKSEVLQLVSTGQTENALLLLQKSGYPKAALWFDKYKAKMKLKNLGMMSYDDWYDLQKQIIEDILTWAYLDESISLRVLTDTEKLQIKELLNPNQIAEALHYCKGLGDKTAVLLGLYTQILKESKAGLLTYTEEKVHLKEIIKGIEELIV
jgi:Effector-associated domain 11